MPDTKFDQAQETDLTLWADSVARNLDEEGHADLAMLFRALVRRDGDGVQDALDRLDFGALDGLIETLGVEIDERLEAGEQRFAEIIDEVLEFAVESDPTGTLTVPLLLGPGTLDLVGGTIVELVFTNVAELSQLGGYIVLKRELEVSVPRF